MGNLGFQEILLIAVIALIVFGPDRLPELARQAGKAIAKFRQETSRSIDELKKAADIEDLDRELRDMRRQLQEVRRSVASGFDLEESTEPEGARRGNGSKPTAGTAPTRTTPPPTDPEAT